jgi:photosystem II stability/assembly factor-like uncharacterized protein
LIYILLLISLFTKTILKLKYILSFLLLFLFANINAQQIKIVNSGTKTSLRGLSVVNDRVVWASGSNGMIGRSIDSGNTWKWIQVKGFEKTDFRDIEAFDESIAVIMGVDAPAYILRTIDGGETWKLVYENKTKGMFLDAMEFWNEQSGIVIGDPINDKFFIARTFNGGNTWQNIPEKNYPVADSGEACFAASGTNIRKFGNDAACFITGGLHSRLFIKNKIIDLPILQGKETAGANSIAIKNKKTFIVVGGDFNTPDSTYKNCVISNDGGKSWNFPLTPPNGYRSCVEYIDKKQWITCGLNGVDISNDDGYTWKWISKQSFNVCRKSKKGKTAFFAGGKGVIGRLVEL